MKFIGTLLLIIAVFLNKTANSQTDEFRRELTRTLGRFVSFDDHFLVDSSAYYYAFIKVEIDKNSKIKSMQFSDAVPESINAEVIKKSKLYPAAINELDSLAKKENLKSCTLLYPVTFNPSDLVISKIDSKILEDDRILKFEGKYLKGNIVFGRTLTLGWSLRKLY